MSINPLDKIAEQIKSAQQASKAPEPVSTVQSTTKQTQDQVSPEMLKLMQDVLDLKKKIETKDAEAAKKAAKSIPVIDWTKITEKDITDLSIDIPVIEQEVPSYMDVHLIDKNYIPRWVNIMPQRIGVCMAEGYSYIKKEHMDPNYPILLQFDTSGNYSCGDVVCLRILKSRYYPAIKANYMRTMSIHGKNKLRKAVETGKSGVRLDKSGNEIMGGIEPEYIDPRVLDVYDPGDEPTKGEREVTRDMVQI